MKYDISIIGAGIVGLATGLKLLEKNKGLKICLLEKEKDIAQHQTGHNSGVIHSGIYYKPGSLKATNCKKGYQQLLDFCNTENVAYELCGKIIVATSAEEIPVLDKIYERGIANGLKGIKKVGKEELSEIEPYVNGVKGIVVPQAGIIDYADVAKKYAEKIKKGGGAIYFKEKVKGIKTKNNGLEVVTDNRTINTKYAINCTGLYSDKVAKLTQPDLDFKILPFRGEYYKLKPEKQYLVKNLIYPVPNPDFPFLGVHFTKMIKGGIEAGPNAVLAFKREGYKKTDVNWQELAETLTYPGFIKIAMKYWKDGLGEMYRSWSKRAFTEALQKLIPDIRQNDLLPGGSGVRAQACNRAGMLIDDYMIEKNGRVVNVCNAPSPAATSSLAIGDTVSDIILGSRS